ncbi:hypothetical protein CCICO_04490 [Corynebacterium ciconiae DSM 44920]|uniref:hypothetical protein n=1 Tax=Corynebacterium ciconiae TaxID=227319 RepID=UPI00264A1118|nr:hypothetical protein [Corynebacterium ciconiae]WKD60935.1 hypothetical protein CCICO_04490 [Corynebacterium ciconiae DSM 44920]
MGESMLALAGTCVIALATIWSTRVTQKTKRHSDDQSSQADQIKWLSEEVRKMRTDLDEEISKRRASEYQNHLLKLALRDHIAFVDEVAVWIEKGAVPPPPDPPSPELRKLLETD